VLYLALPSEPLQWQGEGMDPNRLSRVSFGLCDTRVALSSRSVYESIIAPHAQYINWGVDTFPSSPYLFHQIDGSTIDLQYDDNFMDHTNNSHLLYNRRPGHNRWREMDNNSAAYEPTRPSWFSQRAMG
jgi:hypothetical protein